MKKLIFIDNDPKERSLEDLEYIVSALEYTGRVDESKLSDIEIISDVHRMDRDTLLKILFDTSNVIFTWSSFTANHYGSQQQLGSFLKAAGRYGITGKTYIDCSYHLTKAVKREIENCRNGDQALHILNAIELNNIIYNDNHDVFKRLRFKPHIKNSSTVSFIGEEITDLQFYLD